MEIKGFSLNWTIFSIFYTEVHYYIMPSDNKVEKEFLKAFFRFPHLLIRGLIKRLIPNYAIFIISLTEIYLSVMYLWG